MYQPYELQKNYSSKISYQKLENPIVLISPKLRLS